MDTILIGQRIRTARKSRGLTAEELAEKIGIATESLSHIECASRKPSLQTLLRIADAVDCSMDYLTGRAPSPEEMMIQTGIEGEGLTFEQNRLLLDAARHLVPFIKKHH